MSRSKKRKRSYLISKLELVTQVKDDIGTTLESMFDATVIVLSRNFNLLGGLSCEVHQRQAENGFLVGAGKDRPG